MAKFKITAGSDLYHELKFLFQRCTAAKESVIEIVKQHSDIPENNRYIGGVRCHAGGLQGIEFKERPEPKLWKQVGDRNKSFFFPKKVKGNKDLLARIAALDTVKSADFSAVLSYDGYYSESNIYSFCPGIERHQSVILIDVPDYALMAGYKPPSGMIEILSSEYVKIQNQ